MNDRTINIRLVNSYTEFINEIAKIFPDLLINGSINMDELGHGNDKVKTPLLWFRGQASHVWGLQPSLCRNIKPIDPTCGWINYNWLEFFKEEKKRINLFKVHNYHNFPYSRPERDYLWLCPMQHFGLRTRLLDWTESAEVAFFFALDSYMKEIKGKPEIKEVYLHDGKKVIVDMSKTFPSVWLLNPKKMLKTMKFRDSAVIPDLYTFPPKYFDRRLPTPVLAPYNNERIKNQTGAFVIFPNKKPLTNDTFKKFPYLENLDSSNNFLFQFIIMHPDACYREIKAIGSKLSLYYPEMEYINKDIESELSL